MAQYAPDGKLCTGDHTTALTSGLDQAAFAAALIAANEKTYSGGLGSGIYEWSPHAASRGTYACRAFGFPDAGSYELPEAEWYLDWDGSSQLNLAAVDAAIEGLEVPDLSGASITVTSPVLEDGTIELVAGDDYLSTDGRALTWRITNYDGPDLIGAQVAFTACPTAAYSIDGQADIAISASGTATMEGDDAVFTVQLTSIKTSGLASSPPDDRFNYTYQLRVTTDDGHYITHALGALTVKRRVAV